MYEQYLNIKHEYGVFDCIILVKQFYKQEFNIDIELPIYPASKLWMREYSTHNIDNTVLKYYTKLLLTDTKNCDLIVFRSLNSNYITHFGIYLQPFKLLHVEANSISKIENLTEYWIKRFYAAYRHQTLVP